MKISNIIIILILSIIIIFLYIIISNSFKIQTNLLLNNSYKISSNNMTLYLNISPNIINPGESINLTVELFYNGNENLTVITHKKDWSFFICGSDYLPIGIKVFEGYYTSKNITKAKPLFFYNFCAAECPEVPQDAEIILYPHSDKIKIVEFINSGYNHYLSETIIKYNKNISDKIQVSIHGYWSYNCTYNKPLNFTAGIYTVYAYDIFNQSLIGYFLVR